METIIIKKTAQHAEGTKYLEKAAEGPIAAPVFFQVEKNKVEAVIDGEAIGFVIGMTPDNMPAKYEAKITGLGDKASTFECELNILQAASSGTVSGDIAAYADEIKEAEKASGLKDVAKRVEVMIDNRVAPSVIRATLADYRKVKNPHTPSALYKDARSKDETSILNQALMAAASRNALIFAGEKSTGKNVCAETVAYCRGESFYRINFEKDMLLEDVYGTMTTDNSAAELLSAEGAEAKLRVLAGTASEADYKAAAEFEKNVAMSASIRLIKSQSDIIRWANEGGIMLYDEVNMANANILQTVMNSVADSEKVLIVPGVGNIKLNEHCTLLAGMNPGYAGTMELNVATKSRCGFINFEFPEKITPQLKANFKKGEVPDNYYQACETLYGTLKAAAEAKNISTDALNIRGFVNALKNASRFPDATKLKTEINTYVVAGCDDEERDVIENILAQKVRV